ncbi:unnamed protein product [Cochlearia groenlandica]
MKNSLNGGKIIRLNTQSSISSTNASNTTKTIIPNDLIIEIFSRLPAKSIAICRCLSKSWDRLFHSQYFTESFLARSSTRPRLLISLKCYGKLHFFSCLMAQNLDDKDITHVVDCLSANGFVCLYDKQMVKDNLARIAVICNPSTGQRMNLPRVKAKNNDLKSFLGFDPVTKEVKVLCITVPIYRKQAKSRDHQVLTLGRGKLPVWRKIECLFQHSPISNKNGICINGVLYYIARSDTTSLIACFDVRYETFSFIEIAKTKFSYIKSLLNYKGKLGVLMYDFDRELWVHNNDTEKEKWTKHKLSLPNYLNHSIENLIGTSDNGDIVWVPSRWTKWFYVYYYNIERKSSRRVEIKGIEEKLWIDRDSLRAHFTFIDYVENVTFL